MNIADSILRDLAGFHQSIVRAMPHPAVTTANGRAPWVEPPLGAQPFDTQGSIALPVAPSVDTTILTVVVPPGWDGVIKRISANQTGPGFVQGSGSLIWRLLRNGQAVRGYDNVLTELGSIQYPRPTDGILIYENDVVTLVVNNVSLLGGQIFILGSLAGYFWPKG